MKLLPMYKIGIRTIILVQTFTMLGQNLVTNPSFEEYVKCPMELGNMDTDVLNWSVASMGTTDYFNKCSTAMGVPKNFNGQQTAKFGSGYAGLYMMAHNDYREYLQAELSEQLIRGNTYTISFYISLAEKSKYGIRDIGVLFSKERINAYTRKIVQKSKGNNRASYTYKVLSKGNCFVDKKEWMLVQGNIIANGTEAFLTIGNFKDNKSTHYKQLKGSKKAAYYYIDMVSVSAANITYYDEDLELDKPYVFKDIMFKTDSYLLDEIARKDIERLFMHLQKDRSIYVNIDAHTDTDGTPSYNKKLSEKRAMSVAGHLVSLGFSNQRISWRGHGGRIPVAENYSEEGKQKNRRVEFTLSRSNKLKISNTTFEEN